MRKIHLLFAFMLTLLFSACTSPLFDKTAEAYEESTRELASATSNEDCDRIHDELMEKLYKITKEYPDWQEIIKKEGDDSEAAKKVAEAYKAWDHALSEATTGYHYAFMTFCTLPNAIEQIEGKNSASETFASGNKKEEKEETDETTTDFSGSDIDEMLDSYEEYADKLYAFYKELKNLEQGSDDYVRVFEEAQELEESYKDLFDKCQTSVSDFSTEQMKRYLKITKKLTKAMKIIGE